MVFCNKMDCQYYKKIFFTCVKAREKNKFICKCGKNFTYNTQLLEHQNMCVTTFVPKLVIMEQHKETYNHIVQQETHNVEQENDGYINLDKSCIKKNDSWEKL